MPLLTGRTPRAPARGTRRRQRRRHGRDRAWSNDPTGTAASSAPDGQIARIVEERDASPAERQIREINCGIYAFDLAPLFDALRGIASQNAQGEFYLTDLVSIYRRRKLPVETLVVENPAEIRGINSRTELAEVGTVVRQNKNEELMAAGVTLVDPATTYVDPTRRDRRATPSSIPASSSRARRASARRARSRRTCALPTPRSATT